MPDFTRTEAKIVNLLADGRDHTQEELSRCLWDELSSKSTVGVHVFNIRRKLRPVGQDIVTSRQNKVTLYRRVRHIGT